MISIGSTQFPLLYIGNDRSISFEQGLQNFCNDNELRQPSTIVTPLPKWAIHNPVSWAGLSQSGKGDYSHLVAAQTGTVSNRDIDRASSSKYTEAILWNGAAMKSTQGGQKDRLQLASLLCANSRAGYNAASEDLKEKFGRNAFVVTSDLHKDAAIVGYKIAPPLMAAQDGPPWADDRQLVDLEVLIVFRGSSTIFDWVVNLAVALKDTAGKANPLSIKVHGGFLSRYQRIWPLIHADLVRVAAEFAKQGIQLNTIRFAVAGHSQGGALATLMALSLANAYPASPINLFTFSSPAIFDCDPLQDTCIRHARFAVDTDLVPMRWLGRHHAGHRHITINGEAAGLSAFPAHKQSEFASVIAAMGNGDYSMVVG
jgi:hypothetical protein